MPSNSVDVMLPRMPLMRELALRPGILAGAGYQQSELQKISPVQRHVQDLFVLDYLPYGCRLAVQHRSAGGDLDSFRKGAYLEPQIERCALRHLQHQSEFREVLKPVRSASTVYLPGRRAGKRYPLDPVRVSTADRSLH